MQQYLHRWVEDMNIRCCHHLLAMIVVQHHGDGDGVLERNTSIHCCPNQTMKMLKIAKRNRILIDVMVQYRPVMDQVVGNLVQRSWAVDMSSHRYRR